MPRSGVAWLFLGLLGFALGGCMQATLAPSSDASLTPRDRQLLAHPPYAQATIPESYRRHIVEGGRNMIVSGGLGTSIVPARLGVPPEILHVELGA